ncbi:MAG: BTAD domain-containing putative transcriptional regulator, partial [Burkholderiales bacterium]
MVVSGARQVALLAMLVLNANRAVAVDRLIEAVWHDHGATGAVKRLQVAIVRLRRIIDRDSTQAASALQTVVGGYRLTVRTGEVDADVFERRVGEGRRALQAGDAVRARGVLREALGMWRGPAFAGVAYEEFAQPEVLRLEELRLAAVETCTQCELQLGEHSALVGELEALLVVHPGRERLAEQLMLALYRCGRQGDALDAYARTRAYLSGELGLEPGPALRSLQADILAQAPALQWGSNASGAAAGVEIAAQPVATEAIASNAFSGKDPRIALRLPRPLCSPAGRPFAGRERELARLLKLWEKTCDDKRPTVVIGGEAGIGKTRLAAELAQAVRQEGALVLYGRC